MPSPPKLQTSYDAPPPVVPSDSAHSTGHDSALDVSSEPPHVGAGPAATALELDDAAADDAYSTTDSGYDADSLIGDDTQSLTSYITNYVYENGRQYHSYRAGSYWGPNDDHANELQDLAHHMYLITLNGRLHLAPIESTAKILDAGTGTGIWAIDMADKYPAAHVTGVDLSAIQPAFVPPNCTFEIDDVTLPWTYPADHFDFIHVRELFGCIPDWDAFLAECFAHTAPGGWIEVVEHSVEPVSRDETVGPGHFFAEWGRTVVSCGEAFGKTFLIWREAKERLLKAGYVDVAEVRYEWPMNGWSKEPRMKELGKWNQLRLHDGIEGFMLRLLTGPGGKSYESAQVFLAQMRHALRDTSSHGYLPGTVVYGRKPTL
ncbi:S-adenosyl-L-methionine-dependent methyltransferase [Lineolata rhizophorae]|uniref:S-adenosyl-L-methionine-dependent methyltransferase n=1 Tax=Lineolata rhizophorae TaxID=578093 RepID=A0A6A6NLY9_9PEZI|nr:S-adenosyl-L-methionine-dependent methyltransferase [Lineolata rhizophorae]